MSSTGADAYTAGQTALSASAKRAQRTFSVWRGERESGELVLAPASPKAFRFASRAQVIPGIVRAYPALANARYYVRNERELRAFDLSGKY